MKIKNLVKLSLGVITAVFLLSGCANQTPNTPSVNKQIEITNYKTNPNYYQPVEVKLPKIDFEGKTLNKYNVTTYDFSNDIKWLLSLEIKEEYINNVVKTPTTYEVKLGHTGLGLYTFYYDYKINEKENSITFTYRNYIDYIEGTGIFASFSKKDFEEYNNNYAQPTYKRLDKIYYYQKDIPFEGEYLSTLPPEEVTTNLQTELVIWGKNEYKGEFLKGLSNQFIKWNEGNDKFVGNNYYRLNNSELYGYLYTNTDGNKLGIPISIAVYPYRGGSKILYGSNIKHMYTTSSGQTIKKEDLKILKENLEKIFNK